MCRKTTKSHFTALTLGLLITPVCSPRVGQTQCVLFAAPRYKLRPAAPHWLQATLIRVAVETQLSIYRWLPCGSMEILQAYVDADVRCVAIRAMPRLIGPLFDTVFCGGSLKRIILRARGQPTILESLWSWWLGFVPL
eukprot:COSAG02_NODE_21205_length_798_cov_0.904149_2_plen_138_part_00